MLTRLFDRDIFLPTLRTDAMTFARKCDKCQRFSHIPRGYASFYKTCRAFARHGELVQDTATKPRIKKIPTAKPNIKKSSESYYS